jgi:anti-anti-sigma factor
MQIQVNQIDDITIMVVDGMLTIGSEQAFSKSLKEQIENGSRKVILDMTRVKYIDSLGIGQIAGGYTSLNDSGGSLVLARTNEKVKELLRLTGLQNHIKVYPTVEDAIQDL